MTEALISDDKLEKSIARLIVGHLTANPSQLWVELRDALELGPRAMPVMRRLLNLGVVYRSAGAVARYSIACTACAQIQLEGATTNEHHCSSVSRPGAA